MILVEEDDGNNVVEDGSEMSGRCSSRKSSCKQSSSSSLSLSLASKTNRTDVT